MARISQFPVLQGVENVDFLQAVTLLATLSRRDEDLREGRVARGVGCKRKEILRLTLEEYKRWADKAEDGFVRAGHFLMEMRFFRARDLPYKTQLVPLAAVFAVLKNQALTISASNRLHQWFWCGVFGELYGGSVETRFALDVQQLPEWLLGGDVPPRTITDASFAPQRLLTLRTRLSAAYKGLYALLMRSGTDWLFDKTIDLAAFFGEGIDIHHIFPKAWCERNQIRDELRESIVNKTALSAETNRIIGGRSPHDYLDLIASARYADISPETLDARLRPHAIDPETLRNDDIEGFFEHRSEALLHLISTAMGKSAVLNATIDAPEDFDPEPVEYEETSSELEQTG